MDPPAGSAPGAGAPTTILGGQPLGDAWWTERKELQVHNMEQSLEQELSNAMAGLRDQYRQQPGGAEEALAIDQVQRPDARSDAVAMAEFRSEAAAARDEMLEGLARLRRELESQRLQNAPVGSAASAQQLQQQQQQPQPQLGAPRMAELEALSGRPLAGLREDLQALTRRVEALEAKALQPPPPVAATPAGVSSEVEAKLRSADAEIAGALMAEVEQRSAEFKNVHRRLDDLQASMQALNDSASTCMTPRAPHALVEAEIGMMLKQVTNQLANQRVNQASLLVEIREQVATDLTAQQNLLIDAVRTEMHERVDGVVEECREQLYRFSQQMEAAAAEAANAAAEAGQAMEEAPHFVGDEPVPTQSATGPFFVAGDPMAGNGANNFWTQDGQDSSVAPMISGDLKQGLEELVEKVHKTLNTCTDKGPSASAGNSMAFAAVPGAAAPSSLPGPSQCQSFVPEAVEVVAAAPQLAARPVVQTTTVTAPPRYVQALSKPVQVVTKLANQRSVVVPISAAGSLQPPGHATALAPPLGGTMPSGASMLAGDSLETFKKCLDDLRHENAALRACQDNLGTSTSMSAAAPVGNGGGGEMRSGSMAFTAGVSNARPHSPVRSAVIPQQVVGSGFGSRSRLGSPTRIHSGSRRSASQSVVITQTRHYV